MVNSVEGEDNMKYNVGDLITMDDNESYAVGEIIEHEGNKYVCLVNNDNKKDFLIQKEVKKDNDVYLVNLDNEEEFYAVLFLMGQKHMND